MLPGQRWRLIAAMRVGGEAPHRAAVLGGVALQHVAGEHDDVVAALAQRRQEQVTTLAGSRGPRGSAPALISSSRSRLVAARMRMSTGSASVSPTRTTTRSCSARRSFTCSAERHLADLVEEQRAAGRPPGTCPALLADRAGERARTWPNSSDSSRFSGIAPQLMVTNGPAGARRAAVELARDQLLAGAGLAGDQHRDVGGRDLLRPCGTPPASRGAGAEDLAEAHAARAARAATRLSSCSSLTSSALRTSSDACAAKMVRISSPRRSKRFPTQSLPT